jgi:hypothetical protein
MRARRTTFIFILPAGIPGCTAGAFLVPAAFTARGEPTATAKRIIAGIKFKAVTITCGCPVTFDMHAYGSRDTVIRTPPGRYNGALLEPTVAPVTAMILTDFYVPNRGDVHRRVPFVVSYARGSAPRSSSPGVLIVVMGLCSILYL